MKTYRYKEKKDYSEVINQLRSINNDINALDNMLSSLKRKMSDAITVDKNILKSDSYNRCINNTKNIKSNINNAINNVSNRW